MNILIITFGSRGDVQPYVTLGKGLKAAGHTVTICTAEDFEPFIRSHGLEYGYMTGELLQLIETSEGRAALEDTVGLFGTLKTMLKLVQKTKPLNKQMMLDSWEVAQAAEPDLLIYHPKTLGSLHIAEALNIPAVMALLQPLIMPTAEIPAIGLPNLNLGGWYNKAGYKLLSMGYNTYAGMINEFRQKQLGLQAFPKSSGLLHTAAGQPIPIIHGFSRHVVPRPDDWPANAHVTGYWFLDQAADWQPSAELQAFLEAGEAPVYVGFGSMAGRNPQRMAEIVIEALQRANVRGIIATGWGGLDAKQLPDTILKIEQAPHDWLFPRMAAVVHHGGAGTAAAGLRAGRPTVVVPFFGDQPFWGQRVYALGVGPEPIPQKKLTAEKLAAAIRTVTADTAMCQRAKALGEQIHLEDGIANAVTILENLQQPVY